MSTAPQSAAVRAAEEAARTAYGRLLSWLAWQWRDIAAAEDALADALVAALATWPRDGVPDRPQAWLMTAARRNLARFARHRRVTEDPAVTALLPDAHTPAPEPAAIPDARLRLMFVCAHPAIASHVRSALMLQTVLGIDAARIARAALVPAETMTKRLVRAKAKIRATGLRFEEPEPRELPGRMHAVLEAIYGAYTLAWDDDAVQVDGAGLGLEALHLARVAAALLSGEAEALGLVALLELDLSREAARTDATGALVPLHEQDVDVWDARLLEAATAHLVQASRLGRPGPFQLEAAIQMAHMSRRHSGTTPWRDIGALHASLLAMRPSVGARVAHAIACAYAEDDAARGLALLDAIEPGRRDAHQGWWAARAHLLERAGARAEALAAYERAIGLCRSASATRTLQRRQRSLAAAPH